jgi:NADH dehydrogenase FAD-containing subunit
VEEVLCETGIRIMTSSPVAKVENGGDGESKIHSSLTILTAGVKG